jgi:hypothetical protein
MKSTGNAIFSSGCIFNSLRACLRFKSRPNGASHYRIHADPSPAGILHPHQAMCSEESLSYRKAVFPWHKSVLPLYPAGLSLPSRCSTSALGDFQSRLLIKNFPTGRHIVWDTIGCYGDDTILGGHSLTVHCISVECTGAVRQILGGMRWLEDGHLHGTLCCLKITARSSSSQFLPR